MNKIPENELIKVKEDAIRIQEADLLDTFGCIEAEHRKSSYVLFFASGLVIFIANSDSFCHVIQIVCLSFGLISVLFALYNMMAKTANVHARVDRIFVNNALTKWEEHLDNKHLSLRERYQNAQELLKTKVFWTKASFLSVVLLTLTLSFAKIFS